MTGTSAAVAAPSYDDSVFVNCPFDSQFTPLFHAILFAVHDCGFVARHALEDVGGAEARFDKICRLVGDSRWSIHDLSRVQVSGTLKLPRFNMPFECGLAYGAVRFGAAADRDILVMTAEAFQDKAAISDLAGTDPVYHQNDRLQLIAGIRRFLARKRKDRPMRGHEAIAKRLASFESQLPKSLRLAGTSVATIKSLDYVNDWVLLATAWMKANPERKLPI